MENEIIEMLRGIREDINEIREDISGLKAGHNDLRSGIEELRQGQEIIKQQVAENTEILKVLEHKADVKLTKLNMIK